MYVKKDLKLAPLLESQIEEDLPGPTLIGEKEKDKKYVDKTFYGRIKLTGDKSRMTDRKDSEDYEIDVDHDGDDQS